MCYNYYYTIHLRYNFTINRYNCLKEIPTAILYLPLLEQVEVLGNTKLVWPPIEICLLGIAEIKSFMHESLDRQMCRQNELKGAKVHIVN